jgi:hypothetical protein
MTLESLIRDRHTMNTGSVRRAGSGGAWRVEKPDYDPFVGTEWELWHYGTRMLQWRESTRYGVEVCDWSTGHGSVSDQNGMNIAFRVLGVDAYYSRKGGSSIKGSDGEEW